MSELPQSLRPTSRMRGYRNLIISRIYELLRINWRTQSSRKEINLPPEVVLLIFNYATSNLALDSVNGKKDSEEFDVSMLMPGMDFVEDRSQHILNADNPHHDYLFYSWQIAKSSIVAVDMRKLALKHHLHTRYLTPEVAAMGVKTTPGTLRQYLDYHRQPGYDDFNRATFVRRLWIAGSPPSLLNTGDEMSEIRALLNRCTGVKQLAVPPWLLGALLSANLGQLIPLGTRWLPLQQQLSINALAPLPLPPLQPLQVFSLPSSPKSFELHILNNTYLESRMLMQIWDHLLSQNPPLPAFLRVTHLLFTNKFPFPYYSAAWLTPFANVTHLAIPSSSFGFAYILNPPSFLFDEAAGALRGSLQKVVVFVPLESQIGLDEDNLMYLSMLKDMHLFQCRQIFILPTPLTSNTSSFTIPPTGWYLADADLEAEWQRMGDQDAKSIWDLAPIKTKQIITAYLNDLTFKRNDFLAFINIVQSLDSSNPHRLYDDKPITSMIRTLTLTGEEDPGQVNPGHVTNINNFLHSLDNLVSLKVTAKWFATLFGSHNFTWPTPQSRQWILITDHDPSQAPERPGRPGLCSPGAKNVTRIQLLDPQLSGDFNASPYPFGPLPAVTHFALPLHAFNQRNLLGAIIHPSLASLLLVHSDTDPQPYLPKRAIQPAVTKGIRVHYVHQSRLLKH